MTSTSGKVWWGFLTFVMAAAIWLSASGAIVLNGFSDAFLESLAQGRGLVAEVPSLAGGLLAHLPGDPLTWASGLTVLANLLAAAALYAAGFWTWRNPLSPMLAVGVAFFAEKSLWLKTLSPAESLTHLALGLALAAVVGGAVPLLAVFVLAVAVASPSHAVMLVPVLAYLGFRRQAAYGQVVPAIALLGVGCLLIPIAGDYQLGPSLAGWSPLTLAPLLLTAWSSSVRQARGGIYLSLLAGSALTGEAELASVLAVGDLAFLCWQRLDAPDAPKGQQGGFRLTAGPAVLLVATAVFVWLILPGERYLNRRILIPAQKADVPFPELWRFFSLDRHARRAAQDSWRALVPFPEMSARDFELALELPEDSASRGFCALTLDETAERRRVALLYALTSGMPLKGWDSPRHLAGPLLLSKLRRQNLLSKGPVLVLREGKSAHLAGSAVRYSGPAAELDLRRIILVPYRVQTISTQVGGGYTWVSAGGELEVVFADTPVEVLLSAQPGEIRIVSSHPSAAKRHLEVLPFRAVLSEVPPESLPSRSLVPLSLRLKNEGEVAFGSEMLQWWRLGVVGDSSSVPFVQKAKKSFLLYPGESTKIELELSTPEAEGLFFLEASVSTPDGNLLPVEINQAAPLRTWRRTPAVGTWVEEP